MSLQPYREGDVCPVISKKPKSSMPSRSTSASSSASMRSGEMTAQSLGISQKDHDTLLKGLSPEQLAIMSKVLDRANSSSGEDVI